MMCESLRELSLANFITERDLFCTTQALCPADEARGKHCFVFTNGYPMNLAGARMALDKVGQPSCICSVSDYIGETVRLVEVMSWMLGRTRPRPAGVPMLSPEIA